MFAIVRIPDGESAFTGYARISTASLFGGGLLYCAGYLLSGLLHFPWPGA